MYTLSILEALNGLRHPEAGNSPDFKVTDRAETGQNWLSPSQSILPPEKGGGNRVDTNIDELFRD